MAKEKKCFHLEAATVKSIEENYKNDDCRTQSEFVERAIDFYIGYISRESNANYITPIISDIIKSSIEATEQRLSRLMFKSAVEIAKLSNVTAAYHNISAEELHELHITCVQEVAKTNGIITLEKAVKFQNGEDE